MSITARARQSRSTPRAPSTSAIPTTPLTASVNTAQATNTAPVIQLNARSRVTLNTITVRSAPLKPCRTTLTQWCKNGVCSRKPRPQSARHTRLGIGRYEPMLRSKGKPQKSRRKASSQRSGELGSATLRT